MKSICIKSVSEEKINYLLELFEKLPINIYISKYRFKTFDNLIIHYPSKEQVEEFYEIVSLIIKKTIEYFYEDEFIRKNVEKNYFYLSNIERKYIFEITKKVLELPDEKIGYKNDILKNAIREFLKENKKIFNNSKYCGFTAQNSCIHIILCRFCCRRHAFWRKNLFFFSFPLPHVLRQGLFLP